MPNPYLPTVRTLTHYSSESSLSFVTSFKPFFRISSSPFRPIFTSNRIPRRSYSMSTPAPTTTPSSAIGVNQLKFESTLTDRLPADPLKHNDVRPVLNSAFSYVKPTTPATDDMSAAWAEAIAAGHIQPDPDKTPKLEKALIAWSPSCGALFDLDESYPADEELTQVVDILGGFGELWQGMKPHALCYGGHQFGNWAGQLGDGRAISLGEYLNRRGERWEIQLKGAGKTPYSRFADGRAVLRSSVREFLCSESMFYLGVPTTRALSLVGTGAGVVRDMFYAGEPRLEPGAVVARVAPSFLRLGNFQLAAFRKDNDLLKETADYAIDMHFPQFKELQSEQMYTAFVKEVARRNAEMVAMWQAVGFVHGVMNTDNFSILGLTIDYGPYGYLDSYDPEYTPNTTDIPGRRYKFGTQPDVANWNILRFAQAMVPLCGEKAMTKVVEDFAEQFLNAYRRVMARKLGVSILQGEGDKKLLQDFLSNMESSKADHTNTWRALSKISEATTKEEYDQWCTNLELNTDENMKESWSTWFEQYKGKLEKDRKNISKEDREELMNKSNPAYILRNYMAQTAIEMAEKGDYSEVRQLYKLLINPYEEQEGMQKYTQRPPEWASRKGVCVNSCSS